MSRVKIAVNARRVAIGDLRHSVQLLTRAIRAPGLSATNFAEQFTTVARLRAGISTSSGKVFFDGVNTDIPVTHILFLRFRADVDTESWFLLKSGSRVRVLAVENLDEANQWLKLTCTERGPDSVAAARA